MLYIQFTISNIENFKDFKVVYNHMLEFRKYGYQKDKVVLEIDFATATEEEINDFWDEDKPKRDVFDKIFPEYASQYILNYIAIVNQKSIFNNISKVFFINYLQEGLEVDFNDLKITENNIGIVKFSTGNYPYGSLDLLFTTLKAFNLIPTECFNGFNVLALNWLSEFEFNTEILSDKTEKYLRQ